MPITSTDIQFRFSGGSGNTDPNASLGGVMSTTEITNATLHNLFDIVSGDEAAPGDTEYRGIYVLNNHGSLTWEAVFFWINLQTTSPDTSLAIALAGEGVNATMETIANESTAPAGESFTSPSTKGTGLSLGNLAAGQRYGLWLRRTVNGGTAAFDTDTTIIQVEGDTAA